MIGRGGGSSVTLSQEAKLYHCAPHWKREMPHYLVYLFFFLPTVVSLTGHSSLCTVSVKSKDLLLRHALGYIQSNPQVPSILEKLRHSIDLLLHHR
jgi:hypothetical protein